MFITAVCVIFLIKLRWPKNKSLYDTGPVINLSSRAPKMADEMESGDLKKERIFKLSIQKHAIRLCDH